jgi:curved DNA-binding protein CbpA
MNEENYYKVLGVDEDATLSVIKAAHRKKALKVCNMGK